MTVESGNDSDDRVVVGYFADGADAYRAINELIDEGFEAREIGAAFRSVRAAVKANAPTGGVQEIAERNPATTGSVGGAASHDEAVTPAGLAPGSGNAFPAPVGPGPIPGSEIPPTIRHELRHELPTDAEIAAQGGRPALRHELRHSVPTEAELASREAMRSGRGEERAQMQPAWRERMSQVFGEAESGERRPGSGGNLKFGTGEGHLFAEPYSEPVFENSFVGMGLGANDARSLSAELSRGGAVVSVTPSHRASLAEAIIERNHGRIRFETPARRGEAIDDPRVEVYGRMRNYYRREDDMQQRKAS